MDYFASLWLDSSIISRKEFPPHHNPPRDEDRRGGAGPTLLQPLRRAEESDRERDQQAGPADALQHVPVPRPQQEAGHRHLEG